MNTSGSPRMPGDNQSLEGKTALVTGSSSGIGRAIALGLAAAGADVHLHTRRNTRGMAEVRTAIEQACRGGSDFCVDLADASALEPFVQQAWALKPVDIWINNAGADVLTGDAATWPFDQKLQALWEVDVRGTITLSRAVGRLMKRRGAGSIINIGWDQATLGMEGDSGEMFAATKGAVMNFTLSLAKSLAPAVRVNCIAPGWIRTKWSSDANDYWDRRGRGEALVDRWGTPEDVAAAAVFLASPASSFINAAVLPVNGGFAGRYQPQGENTRPQ